MNIKLVRKITNWEKNRRQRLFKESIFDGITAHFDIIETHHPYTRYDILERLIEQTKRIKGKEKVLVSVGDSINFDTLSFFHKTSNDKSTPIDELNRLIDTLKYAHSVYDHIIFIEANHEKRMGKILRKMTESVEQAEAIESLMMSIEQRFKFNDLHKVVYTSNFFFQACDTVFSHVEKNLANNRTLSFVTDYFLTHLPPNKPFRALFQGHTHNQASISYKRVKSVFTGALCVPLDYCRDMTLKYPNMISIGYAMGDMYNGKIDQNSCISVIGDWEGYI